MALSIIFPYLLKPQRLKYQLIAFLVHDVMKTFSCTFSNRNRLKYQLLGFQVQDVIEHIRVLCSILFQTTTFEISVTSFSST